MKNRGAGNLVPGDWHGTLLSATATVRDAIRVLNEASLRIVLVVDAKRRLEGTVSDGDIRRGLLRGYGLDTPLGKIGSAHV